MKKKGKYNGPGGKKMGNETIEETAVRECIEEVNIKPLKIEKKGVLDFHFVDKSSYSNRCHVYICHQYEGEPQESEEMKPQFFTILEDDKISLDPLNKEIQIDKNKLQRNLPWSDMWVNKIFF